MKVTINIISSRDHCSQIITGFLLLAQRYSNMELIINNCLKKSDYMQINIPLIEAIIDGKRVIYDVEDGYWDYDCMRSYISKCDFYFKRSYSIQKNKEVFGDSKLKNKIYPLGFNYFVTCCGNPYNNFESKYKRILRPMLGWKNNSYFTPDKFENKPLFKENDFKIIFFTRLWNPDDIKEEKLAIEREKINKMRVSIIKKLRSMYGANFYGGIQNTEFAKKYAGDLILSRNATERGNYIKLLKKMDICIGTMGLHESIGWKTAEYVAGAKAIINEKLHYEIPGDFMLGKNYLMFQTDEECINEIESLIHDPKRVFDMKKANQKYYENYLRPDRLIENTLQIVSPDYCNISN